MAKLLRYEFRKTMLAKIIMLAIAGTLELIFVISLLTDSRTLIAFSSLMLLSAATNGVTFIGLWSLIVLHRDTNSKQSYMLFMTPNSSFRILGAKVIECALSILLVGACFTALGFLDVALVLNHFKALDDFLSMIRSLGGEVAKILSMDSGTIILLVLSVLSMYLMMVNIAFFADTLSSALLRGKKAGFLVTLAFFLAMFIGMIALLNLVPSTFDAKEYLLRTAISLGVSVAAYLGGALLMDAKLSV